MASRQIGDKPLPEPILTQFTDAYMRHWGGGGGGGGELITECLPNNGSTSGSTAYTDVYNTAFDHKIVLYRDIATLANAVVHIVFMTASYL